jgi:hypothetical protein
MRTNLYGMLENILNVNLVYPGPIYAAGGFAFRPITTPDLCRLIDSGAYVE